MNCTFAGQTLCCAFKSFDTPVTHFVKKHIESGFIELNNIHAHCSQLFGFFVQNLSESPSQFFTAMVIVIVKRINHGHGSRKGELDRPLCQHTKTLGIFDKNRTATADTVNNNRNISVVTVADTDSFTIDEVNTF